MYSEIVNCIGEHIKDLPFVERYGGLTYPVTKYVQDELGFGKELVFPVTCKAKESDCWGNGMYQQIVPSSMYKSVFYWESKEDLKPVGLTGPKNKGKVYRGVLRLVGWLNLPKLGIKDCTGSCQVIACIFESGIIGNCTLEGCLAGSKVKVSCPVIVGKNGNIFSKYSYGDKVSKCLIYPYDFFALDFGVELRINGNCFDDSIGSFCEEMDDPINCIEV